MQNGDARYAARASKANIRALNYAREQLVLEFQNLDEDFTGKVSVEIPVLQGCAGRVIITVTRHQPPRDANSID